MEWINFNVIKSIIFHLHFNVVNSMIFFFLEGLLQSTILESVGCIWFNRTESKDREIVAKKYVQSAQESEKIPQKV